LAVAGPFEVAQIADVVDIVDVVVVVVDHEGSGLEREQRKGTAADEGSRRRAEVGDNELELD
jgi:hypothetical protein